MNFRNCIVEIPEGKEEFRNDATYVRVRNGSNFSIKLKTFLTPKIAKVYLQGIKQGEFVLEPGRSYEAIERSIENNERFVVYDKNTNEGSNLSEGFDKEDLGLIEVRFYETKRVYKPQIISQPVTWTYQPYQPYYDTWPWPFTSDPYPTYNRYEITCGSNLRTISKCNTTGEKISVIGTEGTSHQHFISSDDYEIDYSKEPTILYLRLVPEGPKPLVKKFGWVSAYPERY